MREGSKLPCSRFLGETERCEQVAQREVSIRCWGTRRVGNQLLLSNAPAVGAWELVVLGINYF